MSTSGVTRLSWCQPCRSLRIEDLKMLEVQSSWRVLLIITASGTNKVTAQNHLPHLILIPVLPAYTTPFPVSSQHHVLQKHDICEVNGNDTLTHATLHRHIVAQPMLDHFPALGFPCGSPCFHHYACESISYQ